MTKKSATAIAHSNIALIKYWGNKDHSLRIPQNGSISFNLDSLFTKTKVVFDPELKRDQVSINKIPMRGSGLERVVSFLDHVRILAKSRLYSYVESENNFPIGTGIASSASAFAALSLAASKAIGLNLTEKDLSRLARLGSGSACRSIPEGFVEWFPGTSDIDSYAESLATQNHWDLIDLVTVVSQKHKEIGSTAGHKVADTSPLQLARVEDTPRRMDIVRSAINNKDFQAMAEVVELDSNIMHSVMMTSSPPLFYWQPQSLTIMKSVREWRLEGLPVCYTLDAGPNVHVITTSEYAENINQKLSAIKGVEKIYFSKVGGETKLVEC